jgi:hypothetical protein
MLSTVLLARVVRAIEAEDNEVRFMVRRYGYYFLVSLILFGLAVVVPIVANAQSASAGNKGVYQNSTTVAPSLVWIDASAFWTTSMGNPPDICLILKTILTSSYSTGYPNGAVIDARGLYNSSSTGGSIACTGTPFDNLTAAPPPTTILLGPTAIQISSTWTLPNNTRIVGEGQNTVLSCCTASFSGSFIIEMGSSTFCPLTGCTSVGIEHLVLDASQNTGPPFVGGIDNKWSQGSSYVNDVNLHQFGTDGLYIAAMSPGIYPGAANSGPYSNITYSSSGSGTPVCIDVEAQTQGLHGITCLGDSTTGGNKENTGIYVNASNNTIEDVHIESFWDGIEIGNIASPAVANVVVSNVTGITSGSTCGSTCQVTNTVHICGPNAHAVADLGQCSITNGTVKDITILHAMMNSAPPSTTVQDDVTGTSIVRCRPCEQPLSTALYVLGEQDDGGTSGFVAYSRFAINPASPASASNYGPDSSYVPTWGLGGSAVTAGSSCLTPGALYSNTSGSSGSSVYVCTYNGTGFAWQPIA